MSWWRAARWAAARAARACQAPRATGSSPPKGPPLRSRQYRATTRQNRPSRQTTPKSHPHRHRLNAIVSQAHLKRTTSAAPPLLNDRMPSAKPNAPWKGSSSPPPSGACISIARPAAADAVAASQSEEVVQLGPGIIAPDSAPDSTERRKFPALCPNKENAFWRHAAKQTSQSGMTEGKLRGKRKNVKKKVGKKSGVTFFRRVVSRVSPKGRATPLHWRSLPLCAPPCIV